MIRVGLYSLCMAELRMFYMYLKIIQVMPTTKGALSWVYLYLHAFLLVSVPGRDIHVVYTCSAIYRDADTYLLDDALSAVDAEVSKHIYSIGGFYQFVNSIISFQYHRKYSPQCLVLIR